MPRKEPLGNPEVTQMQIKYEIFNILLAQHNKFQYNEKWKM